MIENLLIREATPEDIDLLAEMHLKSHKVHYSYFMPPNYYDLIDLARFQNFWTGALNNKNYKYKAWIAELNDKPVGFCSVSLARYHPDCYEGHLDTLHLMDGFTGYGIGQKMFQVCKDHFFNDLEINGFYLLVYEKHSKARKFYERLGGQILNFKERNIVGKDVDVSYTSYGWKKSQIMDKK